MEDGVGMIPPRNQSCQEYPPNIFCCGLLHARQLTADLHRRRQWLYLANYREAQILLLSRMLLYLGDVARSR